MVRTGAALSLVSFDPLEFMQLDIPETHLTIGLNDEKTIEALKLLSFLSLDT